MALEFTTNEQLLNASGSGSLNPPLLTLMGRFRIDDRLGGPTFLWRKDSGGTIRFQANAMGIRLNYSWSGGLAQWRADPITLQLGQEAHVAVTYDRSSPANQPAFYLDGILLPSFVQNAPSGTGQGANGPWKIGNNTGRNQGWLGTVQDARLYSRTLTPEEVRLIADSEGADGVVDGLEIRFPLADRAPGDSYVGTATARNVGSDQGVSSVVFADSGIVVGAEGAPSRRITFG